MSIIIIVVVAFILKVLLLLYQVLNMPGNELNVGQQMYLSVVPRCPKAATHKLVPHQKCIISCQLVPLCKVEDTCCAGQGQRGRDAGERQRGEARDTGEERRP